MEENAEYVTLYDYKDLDTRMVWAEDDKTITEALILRQVHDLDTSPWLLKDKSE